MHIAGGAENRFVLDKPMAAAAAPMGLAGHGAAGLSSLLHEGLARAKDLASKLDIAVDRTEISSRESTVQTVGFQQYQLLETMLQQCGATPRSLS